MSTSLNKNNVIYFKKEEKAREVGFFNRSLLFLESEGGTEIPENTYKRQYRVTSV